MGGRRGGHFHILDVQSFNIVPGCISNEKNISIVAMLINNWENVDRHLIK